MRYIRKVMKESMLIQWIAGPKAMPIVCNFNDNYYGDQVCQAAAARD